MHCVQISLPGLAQPFYVYIVQRFTERFLGLMGKRHWPSHHALCFPHCQALHTLGMRFSIAMAFADTQGHCCFYDPCVKPWRLRHCAQASFAVEWQQPSLNALQVQSLLQQLQAIAEKSNNSLDKRGFFA